MNRLSVPAGKLRLGGLAAILFLVLGAPVLVSASTTVYCTPKGKAYHLLTCSTLKRSKTILPATVEEARARGLEACRVCKP